MPMLQNNSKAPMFQKILSKIFGTRNDRMLSALKPIVAAVNTLEETVSQLSDTELKQETLHLKQQIEQGASLDDLLPKAYALVREAGKRQLGKRLFDVQIIGGIALHKGWVAEAKTGEGKTLMATLPAYLNALSGKGVHVIVPNDYLAARDAEEMGSIYRFLGLTVSYTSDQMNFEEKKAAYNADITYTTNNCIGFDYLRNNMRINNDDNILRELHYCIIDEVDSILIDDARTPLILTGVANTSSELYNNIYQLIEGLTYDENTENSDVEIWQKEELVLLTDIGNDKLQAILVEKNIIKEGSLLFDLENTNICHYIKACLYARFMKKKDVHYVIDHNEIVIIDESTGRKATGRRWNHGIHQAIEAKEGLEVQKETQTTASISYQNLFRLYTKLSGMTGTADTEATELKDIYGLDVLVIPPNKPCIRKDDFDIVYKTLPEKTQAIIAEIKKRHATGQPLLIGTTSIGYSETLSALLYKEKLPHQVLNAKQPEKEASIIASAGKMNAITIATNMAGRGTDIKLGGDPETTPNWEEAHQAVLKSGGLHVLGTERHANRRIDNQLRGRSGRQGDPGSSQFFISFDDLLMKFVPDMMRSMIMRLWNEGEPLYDPSMAKIIENAQRNTESRQYDQRKELIKLDDVANNQRQIIYTQRNELLATDDISEIITSMVHFCVQSAVNQFLSPDQDKWDIEGLESHCLTEYQVSVKLADKKGISAISTYLTQLLTDAIATKKALVPEEQFRMIEKRCLLMVLDIAWKKHLAAMDHLRQGIHFRSFAQKNPTHEFKQDSFILFEKMLQDIKINTIKHLCALSIEQKNKTNHQGYSIHTQQKPNISKSSSGYKINMGANYEKAPV